MFRSRFPLHGWLSIIIPATLMAAPLSAAANTPGPPRTGDSVHLDEASLHLIAGNWHAVQSGASDLDGSGAVDCGDLFIAVSCWHEALPTPTPTPSATLTSTPSPTVTPWPTHTPFNTPIPSPTPSPTQAACLREREPNDTAQSPQYLGVITAGMDVCLSGRIESGGFQQGQYTGDLDCYSFQLPGLVTLSLHLDWSAEADLDAAVFVQGIDLLVFEGTEKPIQASGPLSPETFLLAIASKDHAADYMLKITATAATADYPNEISILQGDYYYEGSGTHFMDWYVFDGSGRYAFWNWNFLSGSVLIHSGEYTIWFPYLVLWHDGETRVDVMDLRFESTTVMVIDGLRYIRN